MPENVAGPSSSSSPSWYTIEPHGFLAARRDKRARRRRGRKPGRYANRENGRRRWISRISKGLMDIRIVLEDYLTFFLLSRSRFDLATWLMHSKRSYRLCRLIFIMRTVDGRKYAVSVRNLRSHVKNTQKERDIKMWQLLDRNSIAHETILISCRSLKRKIVFRSRKYSSSSLCSASLYSRYAISRCYRRRERFTKLSFK